MSISLGAAKRDHAVEAEFLGEKFRLERVGTNGDFGRALELIKTWDGKVDAFGLGGIDLYLWAGEKRYPIRDAFKLAQAAQITPVVDGSGLKHTLERRVIRELQAKKIVDFRGKRALVVSALDRYGMAVALKEAGAHLTVGDAIFSLGIPLPIHSLAFLHFLAFLLLPILCRLPFTYLYPTGEKQTEIKPRHTKYYKEAEIIAGDFLFIRRHLPPQLLGKIIITNTVTPEDIEELRRRGVALLITTTPELGGRSFGTNVMEAVLVVLAGKRPEEIPREEYERLLDAVGFEPRIEKLN